MQLRYTDTIQIQSFLRIVSWPGSLLFSFSVFSWKDFRPPYLPLSRFVHTLTMGHRLDKKWWNPLTLIFTSKSSLLGSNLPISKELSLKVVFSLIPTLSSAVLFDFLIFSFRFFPSFRPAPPAFLCYSFCFVTYLLDSLTTSTLSLCFIPFFLVLKLLAYW